MDPHGQTLDNLKPQPGEPARFLQTVHSQTRRVGPYLLALLPGKELGTRMLVLGGQTSALASFLTSPAGLETMQAAWKQHGRPEHFEVVVIAEMEGDTLVKAGIGGFRTVSITR
jgi:hypothetical protein